MFSSGQKSEAFDKSVMNFGDKKIVFSFKIAHYTSLNEHTQRKKVGQNGRNQIVCFKPTTVP